MIDMDKEVMAAEMKGSLLLFCQYFYPLLHGDENEIECGYQLRWEMRQRHIEELKCDTWRERQIIKNGECANEVRNLPKYPLQSNLE